MQNFGNEKVSINKTTELSRAAVFMQQVYSWMMIALLVTACVSYFVVAVPALRSLVLNQVTMIVLVIATLGIAFYLPARIHTMSSSKATGVFMVYAMLMGAMLSPILLVYAQTTIAVTFVITAGMFAALAFYGYVTKRDLSAMGSFMFMGLVGIIIASLVNFFLKSSAMAFVINVLGVLIFAGLTAYDNQKIREMGEEAPFDDAVAIRRGAILGALTLYLDFINLFLFLLRLVGGNRD